MIEITNPLSIAALKWVLAATDKNPKYATSCVQVKGPMLTCTDGYWLLRAIQPEQTFADGLYAPALLTKKKIILSDDRTDLRFPDCDYVLRTDDYAPGGEMADPNDVGKTSRVDVAITRFLHLIGPGYYPDLAKLHHFFAMAELPIKIYSEDTRPIILISEKSNGYKYIMAIVVPKSKY